MARNLWDVLKIAFESSVNITNSRTIFMFFPYFSLIVANFIIESIKIFLHGRNFLIQNSPVLYMLI